MTLWKIQAPVVVMVIMSLVQMASAQGVTTGAIAGRVVDETGGVLPGVTVEAASPALIEGFRTTVTDGEGRYQIIELRPGSYTVTFSLPGFSTIRREGIDLSTGFTANVNGELRVGGLEETITVTGATPLVDVQNVRTQNLIDRETLDTLPTGKSVPAYVALTLGAQLVGSGQDVGGNRGEAASSVMYHGGRNRDQRLAVEGMNINIASQEGGGWGNMVKVSQANVEEISIQTSGQNAEVETSGALVNIVPKEGGNSFSGNLTLAYTNGDLQGDNLDDKLLARGVRNTSEVRKVYDYAGNLGGPIKRDKVWFFFSQRWWGAQENVPGNYFDADPNPLFYAPDLSRPAFLDIYNRDTTGRITWQAAQKHKVVFSESMQSNCNCNFLANFNRAPEATRRLLFRPLRVTQGSWTYTASNHLLIQAGVTHVFNGWETDGINSEVRDVIAIRELSTGFRYGSPGTFSDPNGPTDRTLMNQGNGRFALTYTTGSHSAKFGFEFLTANQRYSDIRPRPVEYFFRKPAPDALPEPVSALFYADRRYEQNRANRWALYGQDQWTIDRLTLNLGALQGWDALQGFWTPRQDERGPRWRNHCQSAKVRWPQFDVPWSIWPISSGTRIRSRTGRRRPCARLDPGDAPGPPGSVEGTYVPAVSFGRVDLAELNDIYAELDVLETHGTPVNRTISRRDWGSPTTESGWATDICYNGFRTALKFSTGRFVQGELLRKGR